MNGARALIAWFIATLAYMACLMIPTYGLALAPILAAIIIAVSKVEARDALVIGFFTGLVSYFLLLGVAGGTTGVRILAGIGGSVTVLLAFGYHLITPTALAYALASFMKKS